jgi:C-terminal processing protease CtpA/Prc
LHREYSLQVIVSNVTNDSEAEQLGVKKTDEIVIVNNSIVQDLDLDTLDRYFNQTPIMLTLRSSRFVEKKGS